jgi:hypothetical protein
MIWLNLFREFAGRHTADCFDAFQRQAKRIAVFRRDADETPVTVDHLFSDGREFVFLGKEGEILEEVHFRKSLLRLKLRVPFLCRQSSKILGHTGKSCHAY